MIVTIAVIKVVVININIIVIAIKDSHIMVEAIHITISFDTFNLGDNTFVNINHSKVVKPLLDIISNIMAKHFKDSMNFKPNDLKNNYLVYASEAY